MIEDDFFRSSVMGAKIIAGAPIYGNAPRAMTDKHFKAFSLTKGRTILGKSDDGEE